MKDKEGVLQTFTLNAQYQLFGSAEDFIANSQGVAILLSRDESSIIRGQLLSHLFKGNRLEHIRHDLAVIPERPKSWWLGWQTCGADALFFFNWLPVWVTKHIVRICKLALPHSPCWLEYQSLIHPVIKKAALTVLSELKEARPTILEFCGGSGELAFEILSESKKEIDYLLLEYNETSVQLANERFSKHKRHSACAVQADIVNDQHYFRDKKSRLKIRSVDLVLGSGALTTHVLENKNAAVKALNKAHRYLKPGGYIILAGHAHSLITAEDLNQAGFTVINSSLAGYLHPFYIAQRIASCLHASSIS
jgi:ubiquinone/menaquinone biosynthesis C-methylase UbiE